MSKIIFVIIVLTVAAFSLGEFVSSSQYKGNSSSAVLDETSSFTNLSPEEFLQSLSTDQYKLLDVRTESEYAAGHLKNAIQIDYYQTQRFSDYLDSLNKKAKYLIYCRTGHRSAAAMQIMKEKGFQNVSDLAGGYNAWIASGLPVVK